MNRILIALAALTAICCSRGNTTMRGDATDSVTALTDTARKAPTLTFAFCGDIMPGTVNTPELGGTHMPPDSGRRLFDHQRDVLRRVDIAAGNLEGSLLDSKGEPRRMTNPKTYFVFKIPTWMTARFLEAGFDFMGNANNHINDFGASGRKSTVETLTKAGIANAGLKGVNEWAVIEREGRKVGITQFGHGGNNLDVTDLRELRRVISEMKRECDIVVVSFHGGAEGQSYTHVPMKMETYVGERRGNVAEFAHAAIDAGADIVFGHGPHVPRAAELYKDHIIFYSLGNFCTPYRMGIAGVSGYAPLAEVEIDATDGTFRSGRIHSFIQQRGKGPQTDPTNSVAKFIRKLSLEDFPQSKLVIADDGTLSKK